jgi:hypothetical protein
MRSRDRQIMDVKHRSGRKRGKAEQTSGDPGRLLLDPSQQYNQGWVPGHGGYKLSHHRIWQRLAVSPTVLGIGLCQLLDSTAVLGNPPIDPNHLDIPTHRF